MTLQKDHSTTDTTVPVTGFIPLRIMCWNKDYAENWALDGIGTFGHIMPHR